MKIDDVIAELQRIKAKEGNIECTCTHSLLEPEPDDKRNPDVFETTLENLVVSDSNVFGRHVRFWM